MIEQYDVGIRKATQYNALNKSQDSIVEQAHSSTISKILILTAVFGEKFNNMFDLEIYVTTPITHRINLMMHVL